MERARTYIATLDTLLEPVALQPEPLSFTVGYIYCTEPPTGLLDQSAARAKSAGWDYHELASTHAAPAVAAVECPDLLLKIAGPDSPAE